MTVIAIFATLSETSAAISLPFLDSEERQTYIWFLISFPFYLILLFFITLNFNYRSLYAPSDFVKGKHFLKVMDNDRLEQGGSRFFGERRHQQPNMAKDPPEPQRRRSYSCARHLVRLPAPFKDLQIIDTRGKSKKIGLRDFCGKHQQVETDAARVVVFITGRDPEKSLTECASKLTEHAKTHCSSVFCVAYNAISHEVTVIAEAWPFATKEQASGPQQGASRKQSEEV